MENINDNLRIYRAIFNLSTEQMIKRLGVSRNTYYQWVNNRVKIRKSYHKKIAKVLGVSADKVNIRFADTIPFTCEAVEDLNVTSP